MELALVSVCFWGNHLFGMLKHIFLRRGVRKSLEGHIFLKEVLSQSFDLGRQIRSFSGRSMVRVCLHSRVFVIYWSPCRRWLTAQWGRTGRRSKKRSLLECQNRAWEGRNDSCRVTPTRSGPGSSRSRISDKDLSQGGLEALSSNAWNEAFNYD